MENVSPDIKMRLATPPSGLNDTRIQMNMYIPVASLQPTDQYNGNLWIFWNHYEANTFYASYENKYQK